MTLTAAAAFLWLPGCVAPSSVETPAPPPAAEQIVNPAIGGAVMDPRRSIADNLALSRDHTILLTAIGATGLDAALRGQGPFTLFAPSNDAFARLPKGTVESLMAPANRTLLSQLINYHVVRGEKSRSQILADISAGGGVANYQTASGGSIRLSRAGDGILLEDVHGNKVPLTIMDARQSNGMLHVSSGVLLPRI